MISGEGSVFSADEMIAGASDPRDKVLILMACKALSGGASIVLVKPFEPHCYAYKGPSVDTHRWFDDLSTLFAQNLDDAWDEAQIARVHEGIDNGFAVLVLWLSKGVWVYCVKPIPEPAERIEA